MIRTHKHPFGGFCLLFSRVGKIMLSSFFRESWVYLPPAAYARLAILQLSWECHEVSLPYPAPPPPSKNYIYPSLPLRIRPNPSSLPSFLYRVPSPIPVPATHTLVCWWDIKQATNQQTPATHFVLSSGATSTKPLVTDRCLLHGNWVHCTEVVAKLQ